MSVSRWTRQNIWLAIRKLAIWRAGVEPESCPTITAGTGAPTASEPKGSVYLRVDGSGAGAIVYVATDSSGTWVALANTAVAVQIATAGGETYAIDLSLSATGEALVKLADNLASAFEVKEGANSYLKFTTTNGAELLTFGKPIAFAATAQLIADPGNGGAIPVTRNGVCALTTAGAETRTVADPTFIGQRLGIVIDVDGGSAVVTFASPINQTGNNTVTMADVKDFIEVVAVQVAGAKIWRLVVNDGAALSTV